MTDSIRYNFKLISTASELLAGKPYIPVSRLDTLAKKKGVDGVALKQLAAEHPNGRLDRGDLFKLLGELDGCQAIDRSHCQASSPSIVEANREAIVGKLRESIGFSSTDSNSSVQVHFETARFQNQDGTRPGQVGVTVFEPKPGAAQQVSAALKQRFADSTEAAIRQYVTEKLPTLSGILESLPGGGGYDAIVSTLAAHVADKLAADRPWVNDHHPLVLLSGMFHTSAMVRDAAELIAARDGRKVVVLDMPGMGGSKLDGNQAIRAEDLTNASLAGLRAVLDVTQPFRGFGHSLGTLPLRELYVRKGEFGLNLLHTYLFGPVPGRLDQLALDISMTDFNLGFLLSLILHFGKVGWRSKIEQYFLDHFFLNGHSDGDREHLRSLLKNEIFEENLFVPATSILAAADKWPLIDLIQRAHDSGKDDLTVITSPGDMVFTPRHPALIRGLRGFVFLEDPNRGHDVVAGNVGGFLGELTGVMGEGNRAWDPDRPLPSRDLYTVGWRGENRITLLDFEAGRNLLATGLNLSLGRTHGLKAFENFGLSAVLRSGLYLGYDWKADEPIRTLTGEIDLRADHFYRNLWGGVGLQGRVGAFGDEWRQELRPCVSVGHTHSPILYGEASACGPKLPGGPIDWTEASLRVQLGFQFR